ncbi:MAG: hypothetical protein U5L46_12645 [Agrobacterium sp.]|nr:hypothetical protein [Agrobacterium sp.]
MTNFDFKKHANRKLVTRLKNSGAAEEDIEVTKEISEKILEKVEFSRIEKGIDESNQLAGRKNMRPSYRRKLVKKAANDIIESAVRAVRVTSTSEKIKKSVQSRVNEWCTKHINRLKG